MQEIEVPIDRVAEGTLESLIESFVQREGTDYGHEEVPLQEKVAQVRLELETGRAKLTYDVGSETFNILPKN